MSMIDDRFEDLIEMDFSQLTEAQYKKLLKYIWENTGQKKAVYYQLIQCKVLAENYKLLRKIEAKL